MNSVPKVIELPPPETDSLVPSTSHKTNWRLVLTILKPYWRSEERWKGFALLAIILVFIAAIVALDVRINQWSGAFYNAIEKRDYAAFKEELLRFTYLAFGFIVISAYRTYLIQKLHILWRRWLTAHYVSRWLGDARFYTLGLIYGKVDNPDQRISDDIDQLTGSTLSLCLDFVQNTVSLVSFSVLLWGLSGALSWEWWGRQYELPGYMFWFALAYATLGSYLIYRIGRALVKLSFLQQRFEANFRFGLARIREYAESVALYSAFKLLTQQAEKFQLTRFFSAIVNNWNRLINLNKWISMGQSFYTQFAIIFPFLVSAPRYFKGLMSLGDLMQVSRAFGNVRESMSWFINSFSSLASWKATANRLSLFELALAEAPPSDLVRLEGERIEVRDLTLASPVAPLSTPLNLQVPIGQSVLINGPSGCGKSTLLRTLSGIYPYGHGTLQTHAGKRILFVPQKSYLPLADLKTALCYPALASDFARDRLEEVLRLCGAEAWIEALDKEDNWSQRLSLGEQQRLSFARILLLAPDYVFLDEATSALDEASELQLYQTLKQSLSANGPCTLVSVAHRASVARFHEVHWEFQATASGLYEVRSKA